MTTAPLLQWTRLAPGEYAASTRIHRFRVTRFTAARWGIVHSKRTDGRFKVIARETASTLRAGMRRCEQLASGNV